MFGPGIRESGREMSLYCSVCSNHVPGGRNQCGVCNNGFVSQLACVSCSCLVERGKAVCPRCSGSSTGPAERQPVYYGPSQSHGLVRQSLWGEELGEVRRDVGRFGAISDVSVPDSVQEFMGDIARLAGELLVMSNKLASFAPTESTRTCIRECRALAIRLQEEYEIRRGR